MIQKFQRKWKPGSAGRLPALSGRSDGPSFYETSHNRGTVWKTPLERQVRLFALTLVKVYGDTRSYSGS